MHTDTSTAAIVAADVATTPAPVVTDAAVAAKPAKPARAKRTPKPATDAAPVVTVKPAPVKPDTSADDAARCAALRDLARRYYDGASVAAHQRKPAKRDEYVSRVNKPVQRIGNGGASQRDESGLALIASVAKRDGTFDPASVNLDLGIASRLASGGFITASTDDTRYLALTKLGRERANIVVKRAA